MLFWITIEIDYFISVICFEIMVNESSNESSDFDWQVS